VTAEANTSAYWTGGYADLGAWGDPHPYGSEETYSAAAAWLFPACATVEDWGAGPAWFRRYCPPGTSYLPIDFAETAVRPGWSEVLTADLATYESTRPDGILMRHVLEHNDSWAEILVNALSSFTRRMVLVTFIPLVPVTFCAGPGSPGRDWNFAREDLAGPMAELLAGDFEMTTRTAFGSEHVWLLERPSEEIPVHSVDPAGPCSIPRCEVHRGRP
jgi:hypothetical protein